MASFPYVNRALLPSLPLCSNCQKQVGKSRFIVVYMEKDVQVMMITITLFTQKNIITTLSLPLPTPGILHFYMLQAQQTNYIRTGLSQLLFKFIRKRTVHPTLFSNYIIAFASTLHWNK